MSNKRPLSPEATNGHLTTDQRALKRFKLHSIIQELRNEEANLVLLKKLRASQQILARQAAAATTTNGHHPTATRVLPSKAGTTATPTTTTLPNSTGRSSLPANAATAAATRKPTVPANVSVPTKVSTQPMKTSSSAASLSTGNSLEERKAQAKTALRLRLERDLLNIPAPKPLLQDILFVPNPNSLEFQPYIGLEDVVQCLYELQGDRHRLPQRFTDRAQIDEPFVCEHCGTDYTIRWWKHLNAANSQTNILCDRCKKHVTRRTLKSDHSALLKNVFVSAMEQEKEIEKSFQALIKQQQQQQQQKNSSSTKVPTPSPVPSSNAKVKSSSGKASSIPQSQSFATKLSQQATNAARKSVAGPTKNPLPAHQQHFRSATSLTPQQQQQQAKQLQMAKMSKNAGRQSSTAPSSRPNFFPAASSLIPAPLHAAAAMFQQSAFAAAAAAAAAAGAAHHNARPTATKRRTLPSVPMK